MENVILFDNKKEWSIDLWYHTDEPWKHYENWNKPITKDHILNHPTYINCPESENL